MNKETLPEKFANRYKILSKLGEGGMGVVYKANDPLLDKTVAIKVLSRKMSDQAALRFQTEARATGMLNHPNIVTIMDFGVTEDQEPYMVMEYLEGTDLAKLIKRGTPSRYRCLTMFEQILAGLLHAHERGIVHRDLKPSNVIVSINGIKIVDFGIAKILSSGQSLTLTGVPMGSPIYMSPEQARGEEPDERSDIYSLGCLMYEVLSGKPPLKGATVLDTLDLLASTEPAPLKDNSRNEIPDWLNDLVMNCLQKDRDDRPESIAELVRQLDSHKEEFEERNVIDKEEEQREWKFLLEDRGQVTRQNSHVLVISLAVVLLLVLAVVTVQKMQNQIVPVKKNLSLPNIQTVIPETMKDVEPIATAKEDITDGRFEEGDDELRAIDVSDGQLKECLHYPQYQKIVIVSTLVDGSGFKDLAGSKINQFKLVACPIKDKNLKYLAKLKKLTHLKFEHVQTLDGSGLAYLNKSKILQLSLVNCPATRLLMQNMSKIKSLHQITFKKCTGLDAEKLSLLRNLPELEAIDLECCDLTDQSLDSLRGLNINELQIEDNTMLTAAAIDTLKTMKALKYVKLRKTFVKENKYAMAVKLHMEYDPKKDAFNR